MCRTALSYQFCRLVQDVTHIGRKCEEVFPNYYLWLASPLLKPITSHTRNNLCVVVASFRIAFCLLRLQNIMQTRCRRFSRAIRVLKVCRWDEVDTSCMGTYIVPNMLLTFFFCRFCFPNTDHVTIPRRVFSFKVGHFHSRTWYFLMNKTKVQTS